MGCVGEGGRGGCISILDLVLISSIVISLDEVMIDHCLPTVSNSLFESVMLL